MTRIRCVGGPLAGKVITDPRPKGIQRVYSTGSSNERDLLTPTYWPGAAGYYEVEGNTMSWHDLET